MTLYRIFVQATYGGAIQVTTFTAAVAFSNVTFQYNTAQVSVRPPSFGSTTGFAKFRSPLLRSCTNHKIIHALLVVRAAVFVVDRSALIKLLII